MKTIRNTAVAAIVLATGFAAQANATIMTSSADTSQFATVGGHYIGAGDKVRIRDKQAPVANAVVQGNLALDFDFRYERGHVGLASSWGSNNGLFTLSNGGKQISFASHDLDAAGGLVTSAFDGVLAGGKWVLALTNPNGGDPWAAFTVTTSYTAGVANGGNDNGGNDNGGNDNGGNDNGGNDNGGNDNGGNNNGGGQVPAPAPLGLIAAMALFGAWRRKRSTEG